MVPRIGTLTPAAAGAVLVVLLAGAVGTAGAETPDRLGERPLRPGDRGGDVRELQRTLTRLDLRIRPDGLFGAATERQVRRYERREDLRVDGTVSRGQARGMRRRAGTMALGSRTLARGRRGGDVRRLQRLLTQLGVRTKADGVFGRRTERRVRSYERRENLRVDGRVSRGQARGMLRRVGARSEDAAPATPPPSSARSGDRAFPIAGAFSYGSEGAHFGDRGGAHRGEDVFADCGTPLVAGEGGRVVFVDRHSAAGHYVVIRGSQSGEDHVYMHLQGPPAVERGAEVGAGQRIGTVGDTGNATACHLHFEIWTAPGWYEGGSPHDPLPTLKAWQEASGR